MAQLQDEMSDVFGRFFEDWPLAGPRHGAWWPVLDVAEQENAFVVKVELPGMKSEDIDISVHDNLLTISGEKKESMEQKSENCYHVERRYGSFRREIALPSGIDADKVQASCHDGVLTVTVPKSEQAKPKRIEVKAQ